MPSIASSVNPGTFTSRTVSTGTFPSWTPQAGDIVVLLINMPQSETVTFTLPADWSNVLGGDTLAVSSAGAKMLAIYHVVSTSEATAAVTAWTLTNLLDASKQGRRIAFVVRDADPSSPIGAAAGTGGNSNSCDLPGITPSRDGSLVVGAGGGNSFSTSATYTAPSTPWSALVGTFTGTNICFAIQNAATTSAGMAIPGVSVPISRSDGWTAVMMTFAAIPPPPPADDADFFAMF